LFFDEFQRMTEITESAAIEGVIRQVAQQSKHISFVFSGSSRHLLASMFDDRKKPLYKLCDRLVLDRISEDDYIPFIQKKAKLKWKKQLPNAAVEHILYLTERHSYYVNLLCHRVWIQEKLPTKAADDIIAIINAIWDYYAMEEKTNVLNEIALLGGNQAKLLIALAKYAHYAPPTSKAFIAVTNFSLSSVALAVKGLEQKDYLFIDEARKYQLVDPLIKYIFWV